MNPRSDTDRVLRHWLSDGPTSMPDRVIDLVAERISRQPQRRTWRLDRRLRMTSPMKFSAAVAAAVLVAVVGWNVLPKSDGSGAPASPSPTPTAPATAVKIACEDDLLGCAGPLAAGAHGSSHFGPRLIQYVTPSGWANSIDTTTIYKLDAPDGSTSILLWADVSIEDQTPTSCEPVAMAGGRPPSAAQWVSYLTSKRGLITTTPVVADFPGDVDQHGQSVDISMDPGWTQTCPGGTGPEVLFIAHTAPPPAVYGVGPTDKLHLVVLDTTSYGPATVMIEVYGPSNEAGFSAAVDLASSVMDSFVFGCGIGAYGPCGGYPFNSP